MRDWLAGIDWVRVGRTLVQVFGGVVTTIGIKFLLDWGADGVVNGSYVFGDGGLVIACTLAFAAWMNRPAKVRFSDPR